jgi:hypothetical protein
MKRLTTALMVILIAAALVLGGFFARSIMRDSAPRQNYVGSDHPASP